MTRRGASVNVPVAVVGAACLRNQARPLRCWMLARHADEPGQGHLRRSALVEKFCALGISRSAAYSWATELEASPFARLTTTRSGADVVVLASITEVMARYGIARSRHHVRIRIDKLLDRSFKRYLLNCARTIHGGHPMARSTVSRRYGASKSTQIRAERDGDATVEKNWRVHDLGAATRYHDLPAADHPSVFRKGNCLYEQLPNRTIFREKIVRRRRHCPDLATGQPTAVPAMRRYFDAKRKPRRRNPWRSAQDARDIVGGGEALVRDTWERGSRQIRVGPHLMATWRKVSR